jgi:hypothetical protein
MTSLFFTSKSLTRSLLATALLTLSVISAQAQIFSKDAFQEANKNRWSVGILGGAIGLFDEDATVGAIGLNFMGYGFYVDFIGWPSGHENDTRVDTWRDKTSFGVHAGYQLPVTKSFRIIPIVGYYRSGETVTDGSRWSSTSTGIRNSSYNEDAARGFDYGAVLVYNYKMLNVFGACTRGAVYGGIGIEF